MVPNTRAVPELEERWVGEWVRSQKHCTSLAFSTQSQTTHPTSCFALFYDIATIVQIYLDSMMYEMRRKPEPTLLLTQGSLTSPTI